MDRIFKKIKRKILRVKKKKNRQITKANLMRNKGQTNKKYQILVPRKNLETSMKS